MPSPLYKYGVHYPRVVWYMRIKPALYRILPSFWHRNRSHDVRNVANSIPAAFTVRDQDVATLRTLLKQHLSAEIVQTQSSLAQSHTFTVLSSNRLDFQSPFAWHTDPVSGHNWPNKSPYHNINFSSPPRGTDVKRLWDAARFHWLHWMCFDYIVHKQEQLKTGIVEELKHFVAQNPVGSGIHWSMPMEVGIRAHNILAVLSLLQFDIHDRDLETLLTYLHDHLVYLVFHLEYTRHPGNHLDGNLLGLASLGRLFQATSIGQKALAIATTHLSRELSRQVYNDGVTWEKSVSYHRLIIELLSLALWYCPEKDNPAHADTLSKAREFLRSSATPLGHSPLLGDADDGRVLRVRHNTNYNVLYDGLCSSSLRNCKNVAQVFALASKPFSTPARAKELELNNFPEGGFVVISDEQFHFVLDVGDYGMNGWGGHGHNDWGSFAVTAFGSQIFIDSGTGCYTENPELRDSLRRTAAHNTIKVRHLEHVEFAGMWRIKNEARRYTHKSSLHNGNAIVSATMHEYEKRLGVTVTRNITVSSSQSNREILVHDVLSQTDAARVFLHLAEGFEVHEHAELKLRGKIGDAMVIIEAESPIHLEDAVHSPSYGVTSKHKVVYADIVGTSHMLNICIEKGT